MFEKIKSALNFEKTLYHNRLSWKIILPQVFVKIVESLFNLVFQSFKIFISMMLSVIIMERLFNDRMPFDLIVSLFCMLMFFLLFLPFMKHVLGINTVSRYRSEIVGLGYLDENGKPFDRLLYRLVRVHDYGFIWNKFAEISDIFDPITYHLYDSEGNRVSNAILDRRYWGSPSILENERSKEFE